MGHFKSIGLLVSISLLIISCATPMRTLRPNESVISQDKIPLTAALLFTRERESKIWRPQPEFQGYLPRDVHPGAVLLDVTRRSMAFVFNKVVIVENEAEARSSGAEILVDLKCGLRPTLSPTVLTAMLALSTRGLDGSPAASFEETGTYNHFWTAVDDGAVHNALVDAYEKLIPRMLQSTTLKQYRQNLVARASTESGPKKTVPQSPPKPKPQPSPSVAEIILKAVSISPVDPVAGAGLLRAGQECQMLIEYQVSGAPPEGLLDLFEVWQISFGGNLLAEVKDMASRANGSFRATKNITLPQSASSGGYELKGIIRRGSRESSKIFEFTIQ